MLKKTIVSKEIQFDVFRHCRCAGQSKVHTIAPSDHAFLLSNLRRRRREVINFMMEVKLASMESPP